MPLLNMEILRHIDERRRAHFADGNVIEVAMDEFLKGVSGPAEKKTDLMIELLETLDRLNEQVYHPDRADYPDIKLYLTAMRRKRKQTNDLLGIRQFRRIGNKWYNLYGPRQEEMDLTCDGHEHQHTEMKAAVERIVTRKSDEFSDLQLTVKTALFSAHCEECLEILFADVKSVEHLATLHQMLGKELEIDGNNDINLRRDELLKKFDQMSLQYAPKQHEYDCEHSEKTSEEPQVISDSDPEDGDYEDLESSSQKTTSNSSDESDVEDMINITRLSYDFPKGNQMEPSMNVYTTRPFGCSIPEFMEYIIRNPFFTDELTSGREADESSSDESETVTPTVDDGPIIRSKGSVERIESTSEKQKQTNEDSNRSFKGCSEELQDNSENSLSKGNNAPVNTKTNVYTTRPFGCSIPEFMEYIIRNPFFTDELTSGREGDLSSYDESETVTLTVDDPVFRPASDESTSPNPCDDSFETRSDAMPSAPEEEFSINDAAPESPTDNNAESFSSITSPESDSITPVAQGPTLPVSSSGTFEIPFHLQSENRFYVSMQSVPIMPSFPSFSTFYYSRGARYTNTTTTYSIVTPLVSSQLSPSTATGNTDRMQNSDHPDLMNNAIGSDSDEQENEKGRGLEGTLKTNKE